MSQERGTLEGSLDWALGKIDQRKFVPSIDVHHKPRLTAIEGVLAEASIRVAKIKVAAAHGDIPTINHLLREEFEFGNR